MTWLAKYRADYRALKALDGGRSPLAAALIDGVVIMLLLLDVLAIVTFVPILIGLAVWS